MLRTSIEIKYLPYTPTQPSRLKAFTRSDRSFSATVTYQTFDCDDDRYTAALSALLSKMGSGWGDASQWVGAATENGRIYVRLDAPLTALDTAKIVWRVIAEVGGTIATNGIQELSKEERGGVSQFGYVRACLISTAYNGVRALPNFTMSYNAFFAAVEQQTQEDLNGASQGR